SKIQKESQERTPKTSKIQTTKKESPKTTRSTKYSEINTKKSSKNLPKHARSTKYSERNTKKLLENPSKKMPKNAKSTKNPKRTTKKSAKKLSKKKNLTETEYLLNNAGSTRKNLQKVFRKASKGHQRMLEVPKKLQKLLEEHFKRN
ncbi:10728_t:CDS:2, partial [Gigaspora margarita]